MSNVRRWTYYEVVHTIHTTRTVIVESSGVDPEPVPEALARVVAEAALPALAPGALRAGNAIARSGVLGKWGGMALTLAGLAVAGAIAAGRRDEIARALPGRLLNALPESTGRGAIRALPRVAGE